MKYPYFFYSQFTLLLCIISPASHSPPVIFIMLKALQKKKPFIFNHSLNYQYIWLLTRFDLTHKYLLYEKNS